MNPNGNKLTNYRVGKQIIDMNIKKIVTTDCVISIHRGRGKKVFMAPG